MVVAESLNGEPHAQGIPGKGVGDVDANEHLQTLGTGGPQHGVLVGLADELAHAGYAGWGSLEQGALGVDVGGILLGSDAVLDVWFAGDNFDIIFQGIQTWFVFCWGGTSARCTVVL